MDIRKDFTATSTAYLYCRLGCPTWVNSISSSYSKGSMVGYFPCPDSDFHFPSNQDTVCRLGCIAGLSFEEMEIGYI